MTDPGPQKGPASAARINAQTKAVADAMKGDSLTIAALPAGLFDDFDDFFASIAEVQWIDGERPDEATQLQILADAWNFLCIEEQILERDMCEDEDDEDFSELAKSLACPNCNWVSTGNIKDGNQQYCIHCGHSW